MLSAAGSAAEPVASEHRYRLSAAIRPLLFWIGAGNVGGAKIVWRREGEAVTGYELLLGSDPDRAPRRINRWGWAREDRDERGTTMQGVMNRSEDDSLDQAKASAQRKGSYFFKLISARVEAGSARAESTTVYAAQDYTMRQLATLLQYAGESPVPPRVRLGALPSGTRPGLLFALADLVQAGVTAARSPSAREPSPRTVLYTFNAGVYDLTLTSWERLERARYGGRDYGRLVRLEFQSHNRASGGNEHFVLVCGTDGSIAGVPVFVRYQPKWWFKVEGVLDESETL